MYKSKVVKVRFLWLADLTEWWYHKWGWHTERWHSKQGYYEVTFSKWGRR